MVGVGSESVGVGSESVGVGSESVGFRSESVGVGSESVEVRSESVGVGSDFRVGWSLCKSRSPVGDGFGIGVDVFYRINPARCRTAEAAPRILVRGGKLK